MYRQVHAKVLMALVLGVGLNGITANEPAFAQPTRPTASLKSGTLLICSDRGSRTSLWKIDLRTNRRSRIFERPSITSNNGLKFYGVFGKDDCSVSISSNLQWEVGEDSIYQGDIVRRNVRSGKIVKLRYPDNSSDFYGSRIYSESYTICGSGNGSVFTLASDGWLYKQSSSRLVKLNQVSGNPESDYAFQQTFLSCLNNQLVLGTHENAENGTFIVYRRLDGQEISTDQFGGPCWSLSYSSLGECPRDSSGNGPRWYARIGNNRYFLHSGQSGIGIWGCTDATAFTNCNLQVLNRNLPIQFNPYFSRIQGFVINNRMSTLVSQ
jgi:hypothetical protein